jgi:hypothetical protein
MSKYRYDVGLPFMLKTSGESFLWFFVEPLYIHTHTCSDHDSRGDTTKDVSDSSLRIAHHERVTAYVKRGA